MKYFNQLTESEIVELINFCISSKNETIEFVKDKETEINFVSIYNEEDRVDENGVRYARVETSALFGGSKVGLVHVLKNYRITDFTMRLDKNYHVFATLSDNYDIYLKRFMASRFGGEYLQDLFEARLEEANKEVTLLADYAVSRRRK